MDDILVMHNKENSIISFKHTQICNNVLKRETTNESDYHCNYLDLDISISNNSMSIKLFNETEHFNFEVSRLPHFFSNISLIFL